MRATWCPTHLLLVVKTMKRLSGRKGFLGISQAYLTGSPLPPFAEDRPFYEGDSKKGKNQAGNCVRLDVLPHLESALLQLIQDPSLADPPEANSQLPPPVQGPPFGAPCNQPEVQNLNLQLFHFGFIFDCDVTSMHAVHIEYSHKLSTMMSFF